MNDSLRAFCGCFRLKKIYLAVLRISVQSAGMEDWKINSERRQQNANSTTIMESKSMREGQRLKTHVRSCAIHRTRDWNMQNRQEMLLESHKHRESATK